MKSINILKILTVVLIFSMVTQLLSDFAFYAVEFPEEKRIESEIPIDLSSVDILCEDETKRTETDKHYKLSDGSFIAVNYQKPIHYMADDGFLEDIDNTLQYKSAKYPEFGDFDGYINTAGSFIVKFANNLSNRFLFSLSARNGDYPISLKFIDNSIRNVSAVVTEQRNELLNKSKDSENLNTDILNLNKLSSEIQFKNVFLGVDFDYEITAEGIKENIIVHQKQQNYNYSFVLETEGLIPQKNEDGSISISEKKDGNWHEIYHIPVPFMYDANGRYSENVFYELEARSVSEYVLHLYADSEWINSRETVFPVIIDPAVNTTDYFDNSPLTVRSVSSKNPDKVYSSSELLKIGNSPENGIGRVYVKWDSLPLLQASDVPISVMLYLYQVTNNPSSINSSFNAYPIEELWDEKKLTWNTKPDLSSEILDSVQSLEGYQTGFVGWNITRLALQSYNESSPGGILIMSSDETKTGQTNFIGDFGSSENKPCIVVKYRSQTGIDDRYTYTTFEDGDKGIAYVNNYTGGLTYVYEDFISNSAIMPFSIKHIYNSFLATSTNYLHNVLPSSISNGWKLSLQEAIVSVKDLDLGIDPDCAYIYCDEDGTQHYFISSEDLPVNEFLDEDGLGMSLVYDKVNSQFKMTLSNGHIKTFNFYGNYGYIISEADENNNKIVYTYDPNVRSRLVSVSDPSGTTAVFHYDETYGKLMSITIGNRILSYEYSQGYKHRPDNLISITDSYGGKTTFSDGILETITTRTSESLSLAYEPKNFFEDAYRVVGVSWKPSPDIAENTAEFQYYPSYSTTVHYYGNDAVNCEAVPSSTDDLYFTYTFDNWGNTVLTYAENAGRDSIYSVNMFGYKEGNEMSLTNHGVKLSNYADTGMIGQNLLTDSSAEKENSSVFKATNNAIVSIIDEEQYIGKKSWKISSISDTGFNGATRTETLAAGEYTFSAYIKCTEEINGKLQIRVISRSGSVLASSDGISKTILDVKNGWERVSVNFKLDSSARITFAVGIENGIGEFYADAFQLEKATPYTPSDYNILENSGFELGSTSWNVFDGNLISNQSNGKFGNYSAKCIGKANTEYKILQTINVHGIPDCSYILSGWAKADSLEISEEKNRAFGLYAIVNYSYKDIDGVEHYAEKVTEIPFAWQTNVWQYVSGTVEFPFNTETETITSILSLSVGAKYLNNLNHVFFDNFSLVQGHSLQLNYDENNNISNVTTDNQDNYMYEYDDNGKLIKILDEKKQIWKSYSYDADGNLLQVCDSEGNALEKYEYLNGQLISLVDMEADLSNQYRYNTKGQRIFSSVGKASGSIVLDSMMTFSDNTLLVSEMDSLGNLSSYEYNKDLMLTLARDANGNQTGFDYINGLLSATYSDQNQNGIRDLGESVIDYRYDSCGRISRIKDGVSSYTFSYIANRPHTIKASWSEVPLVTYHYDDMYSMLTGKTYANGLTIRYLYDEIGNLTEIKRDGISVCTYRYDTDFRLIEKNDTLSGTKINYIYDSYGDLVLTKTRFGDDEIISYVRSDDQNETSQEIFEINGTKYVSAIDNKEESADWILPNGTKLSAKTDEFGRTEAAEVKNSAEETMLSYQYSYIDRPVDNVTHTSQRIDTIVCTTPKGDSLSLCYSYNSVGNIIAVTSDSTKFKNFFNDSENSGSERTVTYIYDEKDQLIRENNPYSGKTDVYIYLKSGDLAVKNTYAYTEGELGELLSSQQYAYSSSTGSKLSSINDNTVNYDAFGNPLNWRDGYSFTWSGRDLTSVTKGSSIYTYVYNADGLRTSVNGNRIVYDDSGNIVKFGDVEYQYDGTGKPISVTAHALGIYYYRYNQQGDVTGLIDQNGNLVYICDYDAWGNMIYSEYASTSAMIVFGSNIYRYRAAHGYVYDTNTGFYYLKSRYYDPQIGRFLSPDTPELLMELSTSSPVGLGLYTYCLNNPVNMVDKDGMIASYIINWVKRIANERMIAVIGTFYYRHCKSTIASAADAFLLSRGYYLSQKLFHHAFWGNGKDVSKTVKDLAVRRLKASQPFMKRIKSILPGRTIIHYYLGEFEFSSKAISQIDKDLYFAFHYAHFSVQGKKVNNRWNLRISVWDRYNFDNAELASKLSFGSIANGFGWALEMSRMITPYNITVFYTLTI